MVNSRCDLIACASAAVLGALLSAGSARAAASMPVDARAAFGVTCNGVTDDTAALQAAINSGQTVQLPPGVCIVSSSLLVQKPINDGQTIIGAGSWGAPDGYNALTAAAPTVIRPTAAVSRVFVIDGTPFTGGGYQLSWVQGFGLENLVIDMTNMADTSSSVAFDQIQAFDIAYEGDRVVNYGLNKLSWSFNAGSYASSVKDCQGGIVSFTGVASNNAATTISLINDDIIQIAGNYHYHITFLGGAIQRGYSSAVPVIYLAPGVTPSGFTTNTTGLYAAVLSSISNSQSFSVHGTDFEYNGGFTNSVGCTSGKYNDGTHGCLTLVPVLQIASTAANTILDLPGISRMYLLDQSTSSITTGFNGGGGTPVNMINVMSWFNQETDLINGTVLSGYSDLRGTQTWNVAAATGAATFRNLVVKPSSDGQMVNFMDAAGLSRVFYNSTTHEFSINQGDDIALYSDSATTETATLTTAGGAGKLALYDPGVGANTITLNALNGTITAGSIFGTPVGNLSPSTGAFTTLTASTSALVNGGTGGLGYATGAGGAVTQLTSRTTGVTLNKPTGQITLFSAAGSTTPATFTVTDSIVAATDTVVCNQQSGSNLYLCLVTGVSAGSFKLTVYTTGGVTVEAPVFNFTVVKGVTS